MAEKLCRTCKFWWQPVKNGIAAPFGLCQRRAPVPILIGHTADAMGRPVPMINGFFPETRPDIKCGEWELVEPPAWKRPDVATIDAEALASLAAMPVDGEA